MRSVYNYDEANRLTGLTHRNIPTSGGATVLADYSFQYDTMNRITSLTHTGSPGGVSDGTSTFSYDLTSQLTAADHTPARPDEAYQYDLNGNRTGGGYQTGGNNQTTSDGTYSYLFDKEENRTRRTKLSDNSYEDYSWDHRNRLTNVTKKSQSGTVVSTVNYSYDIFNRLIKRSYDSNGPAPFGVLDTFFTGYNGINPTLELSKADPGSGGVAATDLKHRYLWGPVVDQLFADEQITSVSSAGNTLWALGDHLGTLRDIVDFNPGTTTFSVANHRTFDSFGRLTAESNATIDLAFGYTGKYFDEATGLSNHWNRWFDPQLGKWISEDPIGFLAGDTNLGRYVGNGPSQYTDSLGLMMGDPPGTLPPGMEPWYWPLDSRASWNLGTTASLWWSKSTYYGGAAAHGAVITGGKGLVNGTAGAVTSTVTLGTYNDVELIAPNDSDLGYGTSKALVQGSTEILIGVGTGGTASALSTGNRARQIVGGAIVGYDTLGNAVNAGSGANDIIQNGANVGNVTQTLGGVLGVAGNALPNVKPGLVPNAPKSRFPEGLQDPDAAALDEFTDRLRSYREGKELLDQKFPDAEDYLPKNTNPPKPDSGYDDWMPPEDQFPRL